MLRRQPAHLDWDLFEAQRSGGGHDTGALQSSGEYDKRGDMICQSHVRPAEWPEGR